MIKLVLMSSGTGSESLRGSSRTSQLSGAPCSAKTPQGSPKNFLFIKSWAWVTFLYHQAGNTWKNQSVTHRTPEKSLELFFFPGFVVWFWENKGARHHLCSHIFWGEKKLLGVCTNQLFFFKHRSSRAGNGLGVLELSTALRNLGKSGKVTKKSSFLSMEG